MNQEAAKQDVIYKELFSDKPYGTYSLKGYRKLFFNWAQKLLKSFIGFKLALVLRKLTLQNRLNIVDAVSLGLKVRL